MWRLLDEYQNTYMLQKLIIFIKIILFVIELINLSALLMTSLGGFSSPGNQSKKDGLRAVIGQYLGQQGLTWDDQGFEIERKHSFRDSSHRNNRSCMR